MPYGSASRNSSSLTRPTWCTRGQPVLPNVPASADGAGGEKWQIKAGPDAVSSDPRRVVVLRRDTSVVLVIIRGPAADVAAASAGIDSIVASVTFVGFNPNVSAVS